MNIEVKVTACARRNSIEKESERFKVCLTAPAVEGRANKALIEFLADHFSVSKSKIQIIKGLKSRIKVINIVGLESRKK